jgi:hypothetical protein
MMQGMDQMMGGMMQRHNQMFKEMDRMMGAGFDDPFFSGGGRGGMLGGGMLGGGMLGDRPGGGGGAERGGELDLFGGGMMGGMMGGGAGGGNGAMFMQSSVMSSDGKNTYRRDAQHKQVGDVHESNFHEQDSRAQREAIGLRRGLGERSRAVTRTRHAGGDEEVHNVLNGVGESESSRFDSEWQSRAYGAGGAMGLQDRGSGGSSYGRQQQPQRRIAGAQPQRTATRALPSSSRSSDRPMSRGRDIAPQGDIYGAFGSDQRSGAGGGGGGGGGGGSARPQRFARATPQLEPRGGGGGGGGGGGSSRARVPAPSHRMMTPQAD